MAEISHMHQQLKYQISINEISLNVNVYLVDDPNVHSTITINSCIVYTCKMCEITTPACITVFRQQMKHKNQILKKIRQNRNMTLYVSVIVNQSATTTTLSKCRGFRGLVQRIVTQTIETSGKYHTQKTVKTQIVSLSSII